MEWRISEKLDVKEEELASDEEQYNFVIGGSLTSQTMLGDQGSFFIVRVTVWEIQPHRQAME